MLHDLTMNSDCNTQANSCRKDDVEIQQRDIQNLLYSRRLKEGRKEGCQTKAKAVMKTK